MKTLWSWHGRAGALRGFCTGSHAQTSRGIRNQRTGVKIGETREAYAFVSSFSGIPEIARATSLKRIAAIITVDAP